MLSWIRDHFLPHERNGNVPHLFSVQSFFVLMSTIMACEITFLLYVVTVLPSARFLGEILPNVLVGLTNQDRVIAGAQELTVNQSLVEAARLKAQDMALHGYFAHTSPTGLTPWHWLAEVGYRYESAGENLAINFVDSTDVERAWMASPSHHANIVNSNFSQIGIATAVGVYEGRQAVFVVQFFGKPTPQLGLTGDGKNILAVESAQNKQENTPSTQEVKAGIVAGSGVEQKDSTNKSQIAAVPKNKPSVMTNPQLPSLVKNETVSPVSQPQENSFIKSIQTVAGNPQTVTMVLLVTIATLILAGLGINLVLSRHLIHSHVLLRGTALLAMVALVLTFNAIIPQARTIIPAIARSHTIF